MESVRQKIDKEKALIDELLYLALEEKNGTFEVAKEENPHEDHADYMYATTINGIQHWGILAHSIIFNELGYLVEWAEMTDRNIKEGFVGEEAEEWVLLKSRDEFVGFLCGDVKFSIRAKQV